MIHFTKNKERNSNLSSPNDEDSNSTIKLQNSYNMIYWEEGGRERERGEQVQFLSYSTYIKF